MKNFFNPNTILSLLIVIVSAILIGNNFSTNKNIEELEIQIAKLEEDNQVLCYEVNELIDNMELNFNSIDDINQRIDDIELQITEMQDTTLDDDPQNDKIKDADKASNKLGWYIEYKSATDKPDIYEMYSEEEITYLQRMVETECHGRDFESKVHVASVALSRVKSERFPDTIKGVITQPNQFCYGRTKIDEETVLACEYAYEIGSEVDGCLFFHSMAKRDTFSGAEYVLTDLAGHHFYK